MGTRNSRRRVSLGINKEGRINAQKVDNFNRGIDHLEKKEKRLNKKIIPGVCQCCCHMWRAIPSVQSGWIVLWSDVYQPVYYYGLLCVRTFFVWRHTLRQRQKLYWTDGTGEKKKTPTTQSVFQICTEKIFNLVLADSHLTHTLDLMHPTLFLSFDQMDKINFSHYKMILV